MHAADRHERESIGFRVSPAEVAEPGTDFVAPQREGRAGPHVRGEGWAVAVLQALGNCASVLVRDTPKIIRDRA